MEIRIAIMVIVLVATGVLAMRKGYNFIIWALAGGIVGLLVLAFLPDCTSSEMPDAERTARKKKGNVIGATIAVISIVLGVVLALNS